jgi:hypothetical protein
MISCERPKISAFVQPYTHPLVSLNISEEELTTARYRLENGGKPRSPRNKFKNVFRNFCVQEDKQRRLGVSYTYLEN